MTQRHRRTAKPPARIADPPPKRPRRQTLEVFQILAEEGLGGPEGWFSVPWRDGRNVVEMCKQLYNHNPWGAQRTDEESSAYHVLMMGWPDPSIEYSACEEARAQLRTSAAPRPRVEILSVALRARQLAIARSDGGGYGYNMILRMGWSSFEIGGDWEAVAARIVLDARCVDAVGHHPKYQRAFREAWEARLYSAAYALPYLETTHAK